MTPAAACVHNDSIGRWEKERDRNRLNVLAELFLLPFLCLMGHLEEKKERKTSLSKPQKQLSDRCIILSSQSALVDWFPPTYPLELHTYIRSSIQKMIAAFAKRLRPVGSRWIVKNCDCCSNVGKRVLFVVAMIWHRYLSIKKYGTKLLQDT